MDPRAPLLGSPARCAASPDSPGSGASGPRAPRSGFAISTAVFSYKTLLLFYRTIQTVHKFLLRITESAQRMFGGVCAEALNIEEKSALTVRVYDAYPDYFSVGAKLYAWEEPWFGARLPAPPARVLVGACGTGREAIALADLGYRVDALEPAPDFVKESRRRLGERGYVYQLSYEQLSSIVIDGKNFPDGDLRAEHYDAVVLGSGSLTHVLDPGEQQRLLRSMCLLCPRGPILASFFCDAEQGTAASAGRATRVGRRIGRVIARIRGISAACSDRLSYRSHSGFAYTFTQTEIERLASAVGRNVAWEQQARMHPFHYVTLLLRPDSTTRALRADSIDGQ